MIEQTAVSDMIRSGFTANFIDDTTIGLVLITMALAVACAIPTWLLAENKGRSSAVWVSLALAIPVIPLVVVWLLPRGRSMKNRRTHEKYQTIGFH